jgi:hypothetical protein
VLAAAFLIVAERNRRRNKVGRDDDRA